ncbi:MAG: L-lactate dehydrogenase [Candidatus Komeilibacteria bacterium]|nr:L-lactate dehydrogenase [Candidatus Komeilibacteria bacterium]
MVAPRVILKALNNTIFMPLKNKVTIIGAGNVGSTTAYSLIASDITEEIALIDLNDAMVKAQVMDLQHSVPFWGYTNVKVGTYKDIKDSKVVIITCGAKQQPGETRLDLVKKNATIIKDIVPKVFAQNKNAILVMVTNPVDVLTYLAVKMFPKKKNQIFGSGTILDSARFRLLLGQKLNINPRSIHAYIVGEHGDSELPLWSSATIGNASLKNFRIPEKDKKIIFEQAKNAAYAIIEGKQSTYFAIAAGLEDIVKAVMYNQNTVLPLSHLIEGQFGIKNVALSLPVVVGADGICQSLDYDISAAEKKQLQASAKQLQKVIAGL